MTIIAAIIIALLVLRIVGALFVNSANGDTGAVWLGVGFLAFIGMSALVML